MSFAPVSSCKRPDTAGETRDELAQGLFCVHGVEKANFHSSVFDENCPAGEKINELGQANKVSTPFLVDRVGDFALAAQTALMRGCQSKPLLDQ